MKSAIRITLAASVFLFSALTLVSATQLLGSACSGCRVQWTNPPENDQLFFNIRCSGTCANPAYPCEMMSMVLNGVTFDRCACPDVLEFEHDTGSLCDGTIAWEHTPHGLGTAINCISNGCMRPGHCKEAKINPQDSAMWNETCHCVKR